MNGSKTLWVEGAVPVLYISCSMFKNPVKDSSLINRWHYFGYPGSQYNSSKTLIFSILLHTGFCCAHREPCSPPCDSNYENISIVES